MGLTSTYDARCLVSAKTADARSLKGSEDSEVCVWARRGARRFAYREALERWT